MTDKKLTPRETLKAKALRLITGGKKKDEYDPQDPASYGAGGSDHYFPAYFWKVFKAQDGDKPEVLPENKQA